MSFVAFSCAGGPPGQYDNYEYTDDGRIINHNRSFSSVYIEEEALLKLMDTDVDIKYDTEAKKIVNNKLKNSICSGHTAVMYTDRMKDNDLYLVRLMPNYTTKTTIEYHLLSSKLEPEIRTDRMDYLSVTESMSILSSDMKFHLEKARAITIYSPMIEWNYTYRNFARLFLEKFKFTNKHLIDYNEYIHIESPVNVDKLKFLYQIQDILLKNKET